MRLRAIGLLLPLALGLFVAPLAAEAQQPKHVSRIGYLNLRSEPNAWDAAFQQGIMLQICTFPLYVPCC